jgi:hypothetical protein
MSLVVLFLLLLPLLHYHVVVAFATATYVDG